MAHRRDEGRRSGAVGMGDEHRRLRPHGGVDRPASLAPPVHVLRRGAGAEAARPAAVQRVLPTTSVRRQDHRPLARLLDGLRSRRRADDRRGRHRVHDRRAGAAALDRQGGRGGRGGDLRRGSSVPRRRPPERHRPCRRHRRGHPRQRLPLLHAERGLPRRLPPRQDSPSRRRRPPRRSGAPGRRGSAGRDRGGHQAGRPCRLGWLDTVAPPPGWQPRHVRVREALRDEPCARRSLVQARSHDPVRAPGGRSALPVRPAPRRVRGLRGPGDARRGRADRSVLRRRRAHAGARVPARHRVLRRCAGGRRCGGRRTPRRPGSGTDPQAVGRRPGPPGHQAGEPARA